MGHGREFPMIESILRQITSHDYGGLILKVMAGILSHNGGFLLTSEPQQLIASVFRVATTGEGLVVFESQTAVADDLFVFIPL